MRLTDKAVEAAICPAGRKDKLYFDEALPGFGLRVTASGARTFLLQYNVGATKRRVPIGIWGVELTASAARKKAEALRGQVRDSRDPIAERRAAREAARLAEARAKAAAAAAAYTIDRLITDWTELHLCARSASYRKRVPGEMRVSLRKWLTAPAGEFRRQDAVQVLDAATVERGPVAANRLRAESRACWTWAVKRGSLEANPWEAVPRPLARETPRERVLNDDEIRAVYAAAGALSEPWNVLIRLLILTGQRRGEVAGMQWTELDLDEGMWSIPGGRTKNHQPHTVPLPAEAVALLRTVKRRAGADLVFEGPRKSAFSGFGKLKAGLDAELGKAGNPLPPWTLHDLRRTLATGLQRLGVRLEVTEAVLNHVSGSRSGIVGVYQRHGWETEKVAALRSWAAHLMRASERVGAADNLVMLREAVA